MAMDRGVRTATLIALTTFAALAAGVGLHARAPVSMDERTPFERLFADSALADSAAIATLPHALRALDLREVLTEDGLAALPASHCEVLDYGRAGEVRRRFTLRMPDSGTVLLHVTARDSGAIERVEFIRRTPGRGQRGLIWDARQDKTTSVWWPEPERAVRRRVDRGTIPRGGPVPRSLRAVGRQALTAPCQDSARTRR
jgi:hypothetical protein